MEAIVTVLPDLHEQKQSKKLLKKHQIFPEHTYPAACVVS